MTWTLEFPEIKLVSGEAEVIDHIGDDTSRDITRVPRERDKSIGAEGIGIMPVASGAAQMDAANLFETTFQLTAINRGKFSHRSRSQHEFVAEGGRDWTASFKQGFQMGLGGLLKMEDCLAAIASVRMATGKQGGLGDPHAVFVSPRLNFRNGDDHTVGTVAAFAIAVNGRALELDAAAL
jgi:hypothetical protein